MSPKILAGKSWGKKLLGRHGRRWDVRFLPNLSSAPPFRGVFSCSRTFRDEMNKVYLRRGRLLMTAVTCMSFLGSW